MKIPASIISGDDVTWTEESVFDSNGNVLSPGDYQLSYSIRGPSTLDLSATVANNQFKFEITTALTEGDYFWQAYATKDSKRITVGTGRLTVSKDLSLVTGVFDGRTQDEIDLDNVEKAIRDLVAGGAVKQYKIMNREVQKMSVGELKEIRTMLKVKINKAKRAELIKNGKGDPFTKYVGF